MNRFPSLAFVLFVAALMFDGFIADLDTAAEILRGTLYEHMPPDAGVG